MTGTYKDPISKRVELMLQYHAHKALVEWKKSNSNRPVARSNVVHNKGPQHKPK